MPRRRDNVDPRSCTACPHSMTVHITDGSCTVCQATRAETPCFVNRGKIVVDTVTSGLPGEYIGRPMHGRRGSPLGNPYKIWSETERNAAIISYDTWLRGALGVGDRDTTAEIERLAAIYREQGWLRLLCWCAPKRCHGEVISKVLLERQ